MPRTNWNDMKNYLIPLGNIAEQEKIASILSNVDELIQKTNHIIEQIQRLKKGLMRRLLTKGVCHNRFKKVKYVFGRYIEIPEEWKIVKINEITQSIVPGRNKPKRFDGDIPWITIQDIDGMYVSDSKQSLRVTKEEMKENAGKIVPSQSVIMI